MYVTLQSIQCPPLARPHSFRYGEETPLEIKRDPKRAAAQGKRSKAVSWLPLILIIREHDSSIWVSSSQNSGRLARPILLLSLTDVETGGGNENPSAEMRFAA